MSASVTDLWREARTGALLAGLTALVALVYTPVIAELVAFWWSSQEYNYGLLMPVIAGYIIYQRKDRLFAPAVEGSFWGVLVLAFSLLLYIAGILADIETVKRYSLVVSLLSAALTVGGGALVRQLIFPLLLLLLSLPLPYLLNTLLTSKMQLVSSDLGVWFIQLMGFPVLQDGNVISMAGFKMLVAEACSGLRYLYPLTVIALIIAYFYRGSWMLKGAITLSALPITIILNSIRIAVTGFLIHQFGQKSAEGFLHDFEGMVVFGVAFIVLITFVWLLTVVTARITSDRRPFHAWFDLEPERDQANPVRSRYCGSRALVAAFIVLSLLAGALVGGLNLSSSEVIPAREPLEEFPFEIDGREIYPQVITRDVLDVLKADDHLLADYRRPGAIDVNLYIAHYDSQKDGSALHSPKACLPGGGWQIQSSEAVPLSAFGGKGKANRVIIQQGEHRMLVYYWVHQMGNNFANEFKARLSLLWQSMRHGRSDGALVRVIRRVRDGNIQEAENDIAGFIGELLPILPDYLPD